MIGDWIKGEDSKILTFVGAAGFVGLIIGGLKSIIVRRHKGWAAWVAMLLASMLVAVLVGLAIDATDAPQMMQWAIIGVCAYVAEDLLIGVTVLTASLRADPISTIREFWAAIRGKDR